MTGLSEQDLDIRRRAREFTDTLIPYEVEAELAGGVLPAELTEKFHHAALDSGLYATNMPTSVGGRGFTSHPAGAGAGAGRPRHQRPGVVPAHAAAVVGRGGDRGAARALAAAGRRAVIGTSATRSPRSSPAPTSATWPRRLGRDGDDYVVNGTKWHVTSYNLADYCFVQAVLTRRARTPASTCSSSSTCRAPASRWSARRRTPTTSPTTTRSCRSPTCASPPRS